ncbi:MAG: glycosyltransferase family 2 protein [Planctomycetaceae bacterium]|nr:glycosyltransferase family 2 protein [Planctomycetaceae bacterium]
MPILSILIPVYNEERLLEEIISRVFDAPLPESADGGVITREIILVDDASTDGTAGVIDLLVERYPDIKAYRLPQNIGKGGAIRYAIEKMSGDYAIIQDADLEYDPKDYPLVLSPIIDGFVDVVYGSRFLGQRRWTDIFVLYRATNYFLTWLSNLLTGLRLTDMETCYKAFRADALRSIPIRNNRFNIEPELTAKIAQRGMEICEVAISYDRRRYSEGKKITWRDGFSAIYTIVKFWWIDDSVKQETNKQIKPKSTRAVTENTTTPTTQQNVTKTATLPPLRKSGCPCDDRRAGHWR